MSAALRALRRGAPLLLVAGLGCAAPQRPAERTGPPRPAAAAPAAATPAAPAPGDGSQSAPGTDESEDVALARRKGLRRLFAFEPYGEAALRRARAEGRFLLLHGAAEWCHWCHVMEATTYLDPEVGAILRDRFVVMRVDIDTRPDIAERYEAWGWPATVIFSPEAEEIGKFKGFLPRDRMLAILRELTAPGAAARRGPSLAERLGELPAPAGALPWIAGRTLADLDGYYDDEAGGWGGRQKAPIGPNVELELRRAAHGDEAARRRALQTLAAQRALLDPVWGGLYQYSTQGDWQHPHFEKLMTVQAAGMEAYAAAYAATKDPALRRDGEAVSRYVAERLTGPGGGLYVSQDADLGGHGDPEHRGRFVDGHVYYAKDDAGRRALGLPRVDQHVYARENGLGIAALVALSAATGDPAHLQRARRAADLLLRTHVREDGGVRREAERPGGAPGPADSQQLRYLVDAAALGRGLARLGEASREPRYLQAAQRIAQAMLRDFAEPGDKDGRLYVSTRDPAASGVFARRARPLSHNVLAARFLCALSRATGEPSHRRRAARLLGAAATPQGLRDEGRMVGEFLLALDEAQLFPW